MDTDTPHMQKNSIIECVGYRVFAALNVLDTYGLTLEPLNFSPNRIVRQIWKLILYKSRFHRSFLSLAFLWHIFLIFCKFLFSNCIWQFFRCNCKSRKIKNVNFTYTYSLLKIKYLDNSWRFFAQRSIFTHYRTNNSFHVLTISGKF